MKRLFTLITSIVLATSLLAVPCFAAEPEDLPTPQTGVTKQNSPKTRTNRVCSYMTRFRGAVKLFKFQIPCPDILLLPFW